MTADDVRPPADHTPTLRLDTDADEALRQPLVTVGQVLAGRFRIVRFIAQGGMGEVWEAEDLEFPGERVALKTIRPAIAANSWAVTSFRREIQLAKKISHPNVCRVFDLFQHKASVPPRDGEPSADVTFLTMEMLRGETLAQHLARDGAMGTGAALPIVRQMAAGLAAAHDRGIVHGDFKSPNVFLVEGSAGPRVAITDFGLARGVSGSGSSDGQVTSLVKSGNVLGTPDYMAPEQLRGDRPEPAADVYAFGLVLYEMVTGKLPFEGKTPFAAALKRLAEPPTSPRTLVPDLDRGWERAILGCLAGEAKERPRDLNAVVKWLEEGRGATRRMRRLAPPWTRRGSRGRRWIAGGTAVVLVAAAGLGVFWYRARTTATPPAGAPDREAAAAGRVVLRPSVAVLPFQNSNNDAANAWLATALAEALATELAADGALRVVPTENVARMRAELGLAETLSLAADTLERVRRYLGCDLVVSGSFASLAGTMRVNARLQGPGDQDLSAGDSGSESELFTSIGKMANELRGQLGVGSAAAAPALAASTFPLAPAVGRLYAEGLDHLRAFDALGARTLLEQAIAADPEQPLPHAALAEALASLGYDDLARQRAQKAADLARKLPREQRLAIDALSRELAGDWPGAVSDHRALFEMHPDDLEHGLHLAAAQVGAGQPAEALATVERLRRLSGSTASDPRLDLTEAEAAEALSDYDRQLAAARRAIALGEAREAQLLAARGHFLEGTAHRQKGEMQAAEESYSHALALYQAKGERGGAARAQNQLGVVAQQRNDLVTARRQIEGALETFLAIGDQRGVGQSLNNLGLIARIASERGSGPAAEADRQEAERRFRAACVLLAEIGNRRQLAGALSNLGNTQRAAGDLLGALASHQQALELRRAVGDRQGEGISLNNLAKVREQQGDLAAGGELYEQALARFEEIGDRRAASDALLNVGFLDLARGAPQRAEERLRKSLELKRSVEDSKREGLVLVVLARAQLAHGQLDDAQRTMSEGAALAARLGDKDLASRAELVRAEGAWIAGRLDEAAGALTKLLAGGPGDSVALGAELLRCEVALAQGHTGDAKRAATRARALLTRDTETTEMTVRVALTAAAVRLAENDPHGAAADAVQVEREADTHQLLPLALEARRLRARALARAGNVAQAEQLLVELERAARAAGLVPLADRAAADRGAPRPP